jgi:hypothetical protein
MSPLIAPSATDEGRTSTASEGNNSMERME